MRQFIVDERTTRFYPRSKSSRPSVMKPMIFHGRREAPFKSRLLRVLLDGMNSSTSPYQVVNLRLYSQYHTSTLYFLSSISLCWSLQTIILHSDRSLPSEIWKMPQLRHIEIFSLHLPDPPPDDDAFVLHNLQTLKRLKNLNFSEEVCKRIPNIKELEVEYDLNEQGGCFSRLNKLESLKYTIIDEGGRLAQGLKLPSSLKELHLSDCHLGQSDMAMIASLPHLESLCFSGDGGANTTWDCVEGEFVFVSLKHLWLDIWSDLENWVADRSNFPVLERLNVASAHSLKEMPSSFGEIPTLERLELFGCPESVMMSAIKIQQEQVSLGNLDFQLTLEFVRISEAQFWREEIQELGIPCQNVHVRSWEK